jgi:hypothetical protein
MKWASHQIVTFAGTYAISRNLPLSIVVASFSCLPDAIEFGPGKLIFKHRGLSHNPLFWLVILAVSWASSYLPIIQMTESFLGEWGFSKMFVLIPATGALFHLIEDALSKSGIPIWKGNKVAGNLYKTGTVSELFVVLGIVLICLIPVTISHHFLF